MFVENSLTCKAPMHTWNVAIAIFFQVALGWSSFSFLMLNFKRRKGKWFAWEIKLWCFTGVLMGCAVIIVILCSTQDCLKNILSFLFLYFCCFILKVPKCELILHFFSKRHNFFSSHVKCFAATGLNLEKVVFCPNCSQTWARNGSCETWHCIFCF